MDHRDSVRMNVPMKLLLYKMGVPVAIGRIRDVSTRGLFVETEFDGFNVHQSLEVELLPRTSTHIDRCRFKTIVARRVRGGFGLEADDSSDSGHNALTALIDSVVAGGGPGPRRQPR